MRGRRRRPSVLLFQLPLHDTMKSCRSPTEITFYFAQVAINRFFFALAIFFTNGDSHLTGPTFGVRDSREINKFKLSKSGAHQPQRATSSYHGFFCRPAYFQNGRFGANSEYPLRPTTQSAKPTDIRMVFLTF